MTHVLYWYGFGRMRLDGVGLSCVVGGLGGGVGYSSAPSLVPAARYSSSAFGTEWYRWYYPGHSSGRLFDSGTVSRGNRSPPKNHGTTSIISGHRGTPRDGIQRPRDAMALICTGSSHDRSFCAGPGDHTPFDGINPRRD